MGVTFTGDRGEPVVATSGNPPTFSGDLTEISEYFAKQSARRFTSLSTLLATPGVALGDLAKADDAFGRLYEWNGSTWAPWLVPFRVADLDALEDVTGMVAGDLAFVVEGGAIFRHTGSIWVQVTEAVFASTGARDTAFAKASGAFLSATSRARIGLDEYRYTGTAWLLWSRRVTSWTPTLTNINVGSTGSVTGRYRVVDGWVEYWGKILLSGSGFSIPNFHRHSLPLTPGTTWDDDVQIVETGLYRDVSIALNDIDATVPMMSVYDPAVGNVLMSVMYAGPATTPTDYVKLSKSNAGYGTLQTGDYIQFSGRYPQAGADA